MTASNVTVAGNVPVVGRDRLHRDAFLCLVIWACVAFSIVGGILTVVGNLYLLSLGYGKDSVGTFQSGIRIGVVAGAVAAGWVGRRVGMAKAISHGLSVAALSLGLFPVVELLSDDLAFAGLLVLGALTSFGTTLFVVHKGPFVMRSGSSFGQQQHFFVLEQGVMNVAGFFGSVLAGVLPDVLASMGVSQGDPGALRPLFWIGAVVMVFGIVIYRRGTSMTDLPGPHGAATRRRWREAQLGLMLNIVFAAALTLIGINLARSFFNVYFVEDFLLSSTAVGTVGGVALLASAAAVPATKTLLEATSRTTVFWVGSLGAVVSLLVLAVAGTWWLASMAFFALFFANGMRGPVMQHFMLQAVDPASHTQMSALSTLAVGGVWSIGALWGGRFADVHGLSVMFVVAAGCSLLGTAWTARLLAGEERARLQGEGGDA